MSYRKVWESTNREYLAESTERLRVLFPVGSTVHTVIANVTSSGMGRTIKVLAIGPDGISNVSHDVARVLGWRVDTDRAGVYVQGCGMDMAFHLVYTLARVLYDDGYALTQRHV
jgi:hypothetical protein